MWVPAGYHYNFTVKYTINTPKSVCNLTMLDIFYAEDSFFPFSVIPAFATVSVKQGNTSKLCESENWATSIYKFVSCAVDCDSVGNFSATLHAQFFSLANFGGYLWRQEIGWEIGFNDTYQEASAPPPYEKVYLLGIPIHKYVEIPGITVDHFIISYYYYEFIRNTTKIILHVNWDSDNEDQEICLYIRRSTPPVPDNWLYKTCTTDRSTSTAVGYRLGLRADVLGPWYFGIQSMDGSEIDYKLMITLESSAFSILYNNYQYSVSLLFSIIIILYSQIL
eukprot:TRINITY_DN5086_c0_g1_i1.p1 TRINITY_DN5086_c0_g1~~TRINITY_DN5086_c0_g1_i1.p1  ORF type:complete len:317 (-),score=33.18 TRINITY_DN5086_c0_g1_i1:80-916(-)